MLIDQFNEWLQQQTQPLKQLDFFHLGGQQATELLLKRLCDIDIKQHRVLDMGCGIGGTARLLAPRVEHVIGVDLHADYCQIAQQLNVPSITNVAFLQADALRLPFADSSFDLVISEHLQMAIADKSQYAAEISRVLRHGGIVLCFDIFKTTHCDDSKIELPLPWADKQSSQHLGAADNLQALMKQVHLDLLTQHDVSALCLESLTKKLQRQHITGSDILMGAQALQKQEKLLTLLKNTWLSCQQWVLIKR